MNTVLYNDDILPGVEGDGAEDAGQDGAQHCAQATRDRPNLQHQTQQCHTAHTGKAIDSHRDRKEKMRENEAGIYRALHTQLPGNTRSGHGNKEKLSITAKLLI